jgi:8-oxo-dGTP pyrophosphatase MutT (NUDIX family)
VVIRVSCVRHGGHDEHIVAPGRTSVLRDFPDRRRRLRATRRRVIACRIGHGSKRVKTISHGTLLFDADAELLLCHATGGRHWDIPKGMAEPGETSAQAALREAREECGLDLDPGALRDLGRFAYRPDKDLWLHAALIERVDPSQCVCSSFFTDRWGRRRPEMDAFRWVSFAEVAAHCARNMALVLTTKLSLAEVLESLRAQAAR